MASSYTTVCIILLLHFFQSPGVHGAKLTFLNNCLQRVWPAILGRPRLQSTAFELPSGSSMAVQAPTSWNGHLWGRTGCTFNASGYGHCTTGDCGSGQMECYRNATATTLAEFQLGGPSNFDFYDVSLLNGYNLPLLVEPSSGSDQCLSTGCRDDLNRTCPSELRTKGGGAYRSACEVFNAPEYCCTSNYSRRSLCKPTNYSRVFKNACPTAFSYRFDDATSVFTCTTGVDYFITFCPGSSARTGNVMPPAESSGPRTSKGKNPTKVIIIVVPLGIAGVIIISIIIYCLQFKRWQPNDKGSKQDIEKQPNYDKGSKQDIEKQPNDKGSKQDIEKFLLQHGSLAPKRFKYSEIKKITKSFNYKLGQGGYGSVYKGILPDGSLVAVKVLIATDSDGEEFINEVASISRTSHVNIVSLSGFCYEKNKRALVYEFMPNKSLDKFLSNDGSTSDADCGLDLEKLCKIAVGVAKGLEYLHTGCNTRIVHFDIKPQNILLDEDFCPKISDFGLAKLCKKKRSVLSMLGRRGTIGYIAPEVFSRTFGGVSHKSDVYSYGMMVLEMAGAKKFVEADANQSSENYFPDKIYEHTILGVPRKLDEFMVEDDAEIAKKCFW